MKQTHINNIKEYAEQAERALVDIKGAVLLYRNHPDESITPLLKEKTWAPVVVDPDMGAPSVVGWAGGAGTRVSAMAAEDSG